MKQVPRECGAGWNSLIDPLIKLCEERGITILQIKEKFGGLRFYVSAVPSQRVGAPADILEAIEKAEDASVTICEMCGEPGKVRGGAWIKTLCDRCALERGKL